MKIRPATESAATADVDVLVVGVFKGEGPKRSTSDVDAALGGVISKLIEAEEITGSLAEMTTLLAPSGVAAKSVVVVGMGAPGEITAGCTFKTAATVSFELSKKSRGKVAYYFTEAYTDPKLTEAAVIGGLVSVVGQDLYRREKKHFTFSELQIKSDLDEAVASGEAIASGVNLTRKLVNEPASEVYPESFAAAAESVGQEAGFEVEIWDENKLAHEGCGSLLAVAEGSDRPPRLVIMRYQGAGENSPKLGLVGKGVTFDSGGLSLKPSDGMATMKCDMAGAGTVLGAMQAIARLKLPINAVGLVGLVENMVSGRSYKLGDILTARSGKTIEVLNTDAEGRLVLADVLNVAAEEGPTHLIDLATLTGACVVALGMDIAGLMTNNELWCGEIKLAAEAAGELVWQLPMHEFFSEQIKSEVADIKNIGAGRWGGTITAAKFLEEFVPEDLPWTHIDIAGPAFADNSNSYRDGGATGALVRTLVEVARRYPTIS
jgi:leucyl aminopeptidase